MYAQLQKEAHLNFGEHKVMWFDRLQQVFQRLIEDYFMHKLQQILILWMEYPFYKKMNDIGSST